jgi:hypothetical protein
MLPFDMTGKKGPKLSLPVHVNIVKPKEEIIPAQPYSESKESKAAVPLITA